MKFLDVEGAIKLGSKHTGLERSNSKKLGRKIGPEKPAIPGPELPSLIHIAVVTVRILF